MVNLLPRTLIAIMWRSAKPTVLRGSAGVALVAQLRGEHMGE
jgi:hypothetical protein